MDSLTHEIQLEMARIMTIERITKDLIDALIKAGVTPKEAIKTILGGKP